MKALYYEMLAIYYTASLLYRGNHWTMKALYYEIQAIYYTYNFIVLQRGNHWSMTDFTMKF